MRRRSIFFAVAIVVVAVGLLMVSTLCAQGKEQAKPPAPQGEQQPKGGAPGTPGPPPLVVPPPLPQQQGPQQPQGFDPMQEFRRIQQEMDNLQRSLQEHFRSNAPFGAGRGFGEFAGPSQEPQFGFGMGMGMGKGGFAPAADMSETDTNYTVRCDLPGMKKDEIKINIQDNALTISGKREQVKEEEAQGAKRVERQFGEFSRMVKFPTAVKANEASAEYKDGVLTVTVPKVEKGKSAVQNVPIK